MGFRSAVLAIFLSLVASVALAQSLQAIFNDQGHPAAAYVGPGNISGASFKFWYSAARAYSAAVASSGGPALDLRRLSDGATCTAHVAANGNVDYTVGKSCNSGTQTVTAWAGGSTAVASGTVSGTTLTITSVTSGTISVGDVVFGTWTGSGTGFLAANNYITALGTGTGGTGTYTLSASTTQSSTQTFYFYPGITVTKAYDQVAANNCGGASCDQVQATVADQPILVLSGCGGYTAPCMYRIPSTTEITCLSSANSYTPGSTADSMEAVAVQSQYGLTSNPSTMNVIISDYNSSNNGNRIARYNNTTPSWALNNAAGMVATATDGSLHVVTALVESGTNAATLIVDGAAATGSLTHNTTAGPPQMFSLNCGTSFYGQGVAEAGVGDGDFGSTVRANLYANAKAFYGTP